MKVLCMLPITMQLSVIISAFENTSDEYTEQTNLRVDVVELTLL